ncbi:hypothetical protein BCR35DRAFT_310713 [Leucosporidium creatinivorum]|uniref:RING-type E3 ubiquitin transferase n=1 Tax=Leucosporidium creatinivorum TaxID=106004 RepID=A0A1Y2CVZ2_9BASI|nr:hypothetical protein BCR35DRAFT_310713 [Leucosporidium creatinivorum]
MDPSQPPARAALLTPTQIQQQQRPSLSYFIFLSILFFMISNNNSSDMILATPEGEATLQRMKTNLAKREGKREGLARWLGVQGNQTEWEEQHGWEKRNETGEWTPGNSSATVIEFHPDPNVNPVLLPGFKRLLVESRVPNALYHQNLTGFVRGEWRTADWSLKGLGLEETWNTTEMRRPVVVDKEKDGKAAEEEQTRLEGVEDNPASPAVAIVSRRQLNSTLPPSPPELVNTTITHNRTRLRHDFPFFASPANNNQGGKGKVSFNLREEQSTAVGPIKPLQEGRGDGELLELVQVTEEWQKAGPVTWLKGDVTFSPQDGSEDLVLDIEGYHFLSPGTFYAYLTPSFIRSHLFDAISLPLFDGSLRGNQSASAAGRVALGETDRRVMEDRREIENGVIRRDEGAPDTTTPECIFTLYGSLSPLPPSVTPTLYTEFYSTLFHPTGSSLPPLPPTTVSYTLYSPNCGIVLEGEAESLMTVSLWQRALGYASLMGVVQVVLCLLVVRQMERGGPGSAGKIAYTTVAVQAAMDAYFFIIQFTIGIVTTNRSSLPLLVPAFFALVSSLIFGMRYAAQIRAAAPPPIRRTPPPAPAPPPPPPEPEPTQQERAARAAERRANAGEEEGEEETEPLVQPAPAATTTTPVVAEQERDWPYVAGGLVAALIAGFTILTWGWMSVILILIYSYWFPQIVLNVQRGAARQTLRREYVLGTTVCRLVLPTYFWGWKENVLAVETSPWIYALILYSTLQATLLILQDTRLGARFFLPRPLLAWLDLTETESWEYHPLPSPSSDLEASSTTSLGPATEEGMAKEDCPICLEGIRISPPRLGASKEAAELGTGMGMLEWEKERAELRWGYMVPPCGHLAHTECLEGWIAVKSVCPSCRARLPPL